MPEQKICPNVNKSNHPGEGKVIDRKGCCRDCGHQMCARPKMHKSSHTIMYITQYDYNGALEG